MSLLCRDLFFALPLAFLNGCSCDGPLPELDAGTVGVGDAGGDDLDGNDAGPGDDGGLDDDAGAADGGLDDDAGHADAGPGDDGGLDDDAGTADGGVDEDGGLDDAGLDLDDGGRNDAGLDLNDGGLDDGGFSDGGPEVDAGADAGGTADAGVPAEASLDVYIYVSNTCGMEVQPQSITVPAGQEVYVDWHNLSADYPVDVWLSYGGGYLDLQPGTTWDEPISHCWGINPHTEYADISTACSDFRLYFTCE